MRAKCVLLTTAWNVHKARIIESGLAALECKSKMRFPESDSYARTHRVSVE